jgi:hypothetical protein
VDVVEVSRIAIQEAALDRFRIREVRYYRGKYDRVLSRQVIAHFYFPGDIDDAGIERNYLRVFDYPFNRAPQAFALTFRALGQKIGEFMEIGGYITTGPRSRQLAKVWEQLVSQLESRVLRAQECAVRFGEGECGDYQLNGTGRCQSDRLITAFALLLFQRVLQYEIGFNINIHCTVLNSM